MPAKGRRSMLLSNLFLLTLIFYELIGDLDALRCSKGERVVDDGRSTHCALCQPGYYQPTENESQRCQGCRKCAKEDGSFEKAPCTRFTNTVCECLEGFVPAVSDHALCICGPGFETTQGVCSKCRPGYFSPGEKPCQKRNECEAMGVKQHGNDRSDNVCNEKPQSDSQPVTRSPSVTSILRAMTTIRPHEGVQTQRTPSTTTSPPREDGVHPPSITGNHTVVVIVCLGIAGLLVWTVITCKMHITPCWMKKTMQTRDSCRRPVEESGDSSETSVKLNLEL